MYQKQFKESLLDSFMISPQSHELRGLRCHDCEMTKKKICTLYIETKNILRCAACILHTWCIIHSMHAPQQRYHDRRWLNVREKWPWFPHQHICRIGSTRVIPSRHRIKRWFTLVNTFVGHIISIAYAAKDKRLFCCVSVSDEKSLRTCSSIPENWNPVAICSVFIRSWLKSIPPAS